MTSYIDHIWEIISWNAETLADVPSRELVATVLELVELDLANEDVQVGQLTS
jgi:hypothetical protein